MLLASDHQTRVLEPFFPTHYSVLVLAPIILFALPITPPY